MTRLGPGIRSVLERGAFCHLAGRAPGGPHLTPVVFAFSGGSVWVTTSRGSAKARSWRVDPGVSGLVRDGEDAVRFEGRVTAYDLLDAGTWPNAIARSPAVAAASLRFSRKNARFFAGYAVDARHVPLAWTPPGRVFAEVDIASAMLLRGRDVVERIGMTEHAARSRAGFRAVATADALAALPGHVRGSLGEDGVGSLALGGPRPAVLPVRWLADQGPILAVVPLAALGGVEGGPGFDAALAIDRASSWRARLMLGCMVQGTAELFVPAEVRTGRRALATAIERTGGAPDLDALVRLRPGRVVWWSGWTSASARVA